MFNLIKKDILLNARYLLLTILVVFAGSFLLLMDNDIQQYYAALYFLPLTILNMVIGKLNYLDDQKDIRNFLKSLPFSKFTLVGARYIETVLLIFLSIAYSVIVESFFYKGLNLSNVINDAMIACSVIIIYYSLYLWLFYFKNYRVSQNALVVCCLLLLVFYGIVSTFNISINFNFSAIVFIPISIGIYFLSYYMSCKSV